MKCDIPLKPRRAESDLSALNVRSALRAEGLAGPERSDALEPT
jgi:hypothetical protein